MQIANHKTLTFTLCLFKQRKNIKHNKTVFKNYQNSRFGHLFKVSKGTKIRNRCNQVPHLTQDANGKVTNSQLDTTNEGQEVSPFPAGDHRATINRRAQRHSKHKTPVLRQSNKSCQFHAILANFIFIMLALAF